jgi:hypothetical protein
MIGLIHLADFFNNGSVAAFCGAFAAFLLVAATDLRRRYLVRSLLNKHLANLLCHAHRKLQSIQTSIALVREDNRITDAPIMPFPVKTIDDYRAQVLDLLSPEQMQALDALAYWMTAIDGVIAEGTVVASGIRRLAQRKGPDTERMALAEEYISTMCDAEMNTEYLVEMLGYYLSEKPQKIIEFKHPVRHKK